MIQNSELKNDNAVSPVVGVMLMLIVTIIIAGIIAVFAGGLITSQEPAPEIAAKTEIWSGESYNYYAYGRFALTVESVSKPINTADLQLITKWKTKDASGETTVYPTGLNTDYNGYSYNSPIGFGPGVSGEIKTAGQYNPGQFFGNYTLTAGTAMTANGAGTSTSSPSSTYEQHTAGDGMDAVLGSNWSGNVTKGTMVTVQLKYTPTNTIIYNQEVTVQ